MRQPRQRPEQALQQVCFKWLRLQYPKLLAFHVPNEGTRDPRRGAIMKSMGVLAGVPDVLIALMRQSPTPGLMYSGLAIELKAPKGRSTPIQLETQERFRLAGWRVHTDVTTIGDFMRLVTDYVGR